MNPSTRPTMKTQHTATPWTLSTYSSDSGRFTINEIYATIHPAYDGSGTGKYPNDVIISKEVAKANAEFICRAVNSHDALVAALDKLEASCENLHCALQSTASMDPNDTRIPVITGRVIKDLFVMRNQSRAALAQAEGRAS